MAKSFIVNAQGSDFKRNAIVDEKGVLIKIIDWDFKDDDDETIVLEILILSGSRKDVIIKDFISFAKTSKMNWKYAALRDAIGNPIPPTGVDSFDLIELVNRKLVADLIKSKDGKFQNLNYVPYEEKLVESLVHEFPEVKATKVKPVIADTDTEQGLDTADAKDDDLPF